MAGRLGDILVARGAITEEQLLAALAEKNAFGMLGETLVARGMITNDQLGAALAQQFDVPYREVPPETVNPQVVCLLPEALARQRLIAPVAVKGGTMTLAMVAPDDMNAISEAELISGYQVDPIVALRHDVIATLDRGWSFGGYLAALAVLRRPDVFHAAIAGAPVTEWRLYDTHYTERYLGDPAVKPEQYDASSLLPLAPQLERPLLLIHGLADDNVVAAHTLQLSAALLAAGRAHEVLPLVGVTHMTPQETIAENLLLHQLEFLRRSLGLHSVGTATPPSSNVPDEE